MQARQFAFFLTALVFAAGCRRPQGPVIQKNTWSVLSVSPNEVVVAVEVKAGSRVWLQYDGVDAGVSTVPGNDLKTVVVYRMGKAGYTVDGKGLARIDNTQAKNVVFHEKPIESDDGLVIGTYTRWGAEATIVFRLQ